STDARLEMLRVAFPLDLDGSEGLFDSCKVGRRQRDGCTAQILFEAMKFGRSRDGYNPRLLCKQPRQRYLRSRYILLCSDLAQQVDQLLVSTASVFCKARDDVAEVGAVELG